MTEEFQSPGGTAFICETCGVQFQKSKSPPARCPICEDFRQYVGLEGQRWTCLKELRRGHKNNMEEIAPGILSIHTQPKFGIGQRALVVRTSDFSVVWDCVSLIDETTVSAVQDFGRISAIAISHPHYYATMADWSEALGGIPIFIHEADRRWVMHRDDRINFWSGGSYRLSAGLTLIRCGGHFEGAQVLHSNTGAIFTGDVIQVCPDRKWVSFMRSYPNYIPLPENSVRRIASAIEPFEFNTLYGAWPRHEIVHDAKNAVRRSVDRYIRALTSVICE